MSLSTLKVSSMTSIICRSAVKRGHCHRVRTLPSQACAWRQKRNYIIASHHDTYFTKSRKMIITKMIDRCGTEKDNNQHHFKWKVRRMSVLRMSIEHNIAERKGLSFTRVRRKTTTRSDFVEHNFPSWLWASGGVLLPILMTALCIQHNKNWKIACTHWTKSLIFNLIVYSCFVLLDNIYAFYLYNIVSWLAQ